MSATIADERPRTEKEKKVNKKIYECSTQELDVLYDILCQSEGEDKKGRQELQKRRFRELILPLGQEGNEEQKKWALLKLVEEAQDFIRYYIDKYYGTYKPVYGPDLEEECYLWICQNGFRYDPDKGTYSTFLTQNLHGVIHKYLNEQLNNMSVHHGDRMNNVKKAQSQFDQEGKDYTVEDLAVKTGYPISVIRKTLEYIHYNNRMYFDGDDSGYLNTLPSPAPNPEDEVLRNEVREVLKKALEKLPPKYRDVIGARFMPENYFKNYHQSPQDKAPGFEAIAALLGTTPTKVRGAYRRALIRLRKDPGITAISDAFRRRNDNAVRDFRVICIDDTDIFPDDPDE